ncbi:putative zinc-ribbon domain [Caudoviricetes sp.]|nr:putative zinc-ribbon domain [Caudoviricetes sp.]
MSAEVLPFKPRAEAAVPHLQGEAVCVVCSHEWKADIAVGGAVNSMECEVCHSMKGVFKRFVQYTDLPQWRCGACSGILFTAILIGDAPTVACASCGDLRNAIDLFNR